MALAEFNYFIYDKELFVIIKVIRIWRLEFKGIDRIFTVVTDY